MEPPEPLEKTTAAVKDIREDVAECLAIVDELFPPEALQGHIQRPIEHRQYTDERGEPR